MYGSRPAVQVWINSDSDADAAALAEALQKEVTANAGAQLKGFVIFDNPRAEPPSAMASRLNRIAASQPVPSIDLAYLGGPADENVREYQMNTDPAVRNTILLYRDKEVKAKFINLPADAAGLAALDAAIKKIIK